eukprot:CAMPEP_0204883258 /NCGR_PEP_ID=MMETSP1349-20130617/4092_1 /ASSEMBLY_ACC=CAM_ASM_000710 /TAXON_ID=215587 /ORGANISM="Aplanochytrium stocchinoi, Strain GSBS06" /LENGTH=246 /DNA_ID=CAMNT_0052042927 /DNA_START=141 /DNA_END=878 /DNA_ORIENTATION=+
MNALTINQQWETFALLEHMARDDNVRVVIWTGSGDRAFNVGADLRGDRTIHMPKHIREKYLERNMGPIKGNFVLNNQTKAFWDFPKPSICAVNGMAVGGAANIVFCNFHDLVIVSKTAQFFYPFPKLGFTPELSSSFIIPRIVGFAKAKEMMFLGERFDAEDALRLGLINKVVEPQSLMSEAMKMAEKLVHFHPDALRFSKKIINQHVRNELDSILEQEQEAILASLAATGGPPNVGKWMKKKEAW